MIPTHAQRNTERRLYAPVGGKREGTVLEVSWDGDGEVEATPWMSRAVVDREGKLHTLPLEVSLIWPISLRPRSSIISSLAF